MERWTEITARGPADARDTAAGLLIGAGSPGVVEEDSNPGPVGKLVSASLWADEDYSPTRPGTGKKGDKAVLRAYLSGPGAKAPNVSGLKKGLKEIGWTISTKPYDDKTDWRTKWRSGVRTVSVRGKKVGVTVRPTWRKGAVARGVKLVEIDPGMAFGTGSHGTTRTCLKAIITLLEGSVRPSTASLLDVGTGTGVLAISAVKLGVKKAVGVDIDPVALGVARKNARLNRSRVTISRKPVEDVKGAFTIVVANILSAELERLAPAIAERVRAGGFLILSGILREEAGHVRECYEGLGLKYLRKYSTPEWATLVFASPRVGAERKGRVKGRTSG